MHPFWKYTCPLCCSNLTVTENISSYAGTCNIYDCEEGHYSLSENADSGQPVLARYRIPPFHLLYTPEETNVYILDRPPSTLYHYSFTVPGHPPIDRFKHLKAFI